MAKTKRRTASLVWTDDEVQLLLTVTLDYKLSRDAENVDWESSQRKYWDILQRFLENYPSPEAASATGKDFPHKKKDITKAQLISKMKVIRSKYRQAAEAGQKNCYGRVVLLFYKQCQAIWGGSPAVHPISGGMETCDVSPETPIASEESLTEEISMHSRQQLYASLPNHRQNKLKWLRSSDIAQEDLEIKRRLLRQLEITDNQFINTIGRLTSSVDRMNSNIELLVQHLMGTSSRDSRMPPPSPQPQPFGSTRGPEEFSPLTGLFKVELS